MRALEVYRYILHELDKHESPTFTVDAFNYFWNSATDETVKEYRRDFDLRQKDLDDLRAIMVLNHPITFVNGKVDLPEKYLHLLYLEAVLKMTKETNDHDVDDIVTVYPKRLKTNQKGFAQENSYQKPSAGYSYFQVDKDSLYVLVGDDATVQTGKMDYLLTPEIVYLNPDKASNFTLEENNSTLQFPDTVVRNIIKNCKRIFLENIESQRYASTVQEEAIRKQNE